MKVRVAAPFFALAAAVTLLYLRPIGFGETFCLRDHLTLNVPSRAAVADAFAHGRVPEWWDRIGLGVPLAADPLHEVAYPPTWILRWIGPAVGTDLLAIAHVFWFGLGLYLLARRWGASRQAATLLAAALCASGYSVSMIVNVLALSMAWMPWLLWACDRLAAGEHLRNAALVALVLGMQIIAADPASVITSVLAAVAMTLVRAERRLPAFLRMAGAMAGGVAVSAVALVPAMMLLRTSERASGIATESATAWSMHPLRMIEWFWPRLLGDAAEPAHNLARVYADTGGGLDPSWTLSIYVGAPVILLAGCVAVTDRRWRWLGMASLGLVVLALGRFTPIYAAWRYLFLPERLIRYPEKHFAGVLVLWCALAAVALDVVLRERHRRLAMVAFGAAVLLLVGAGVVALVRRNASVPGVDAQAALGLAMTGAIMAGAQTALFGVALLLRGRAAFALAAASIFAPLLAHAWEVQPLIARSVLDHPPALVAGQQPGRLYRPRDLPVHGALAMRETAAENTAAPYGFQHVPGYLTTHASRFHQFWDAAAAHGTRLLQLFDVEWAILPARTPVPWTKVAATADGGIVLGRIAGRRPRAFVAHGWRWHATDDDATKALFAVPPPSADEVQLIGSGTPSPSAGEPAPCTRASDRPEHVELTCTGPGYAVLLDAWAPGWTATIDSTAADIVRADAVARAVAIDAGAHRIEFRYRTPGLRTGGAISLAALAACLALIVRRRRSEP